VLLTINGGVLSFPPVLPHNIARFIMTNITITMADPLKKKQRKPDSSYDQKVQSNKKILESKEKWRQQKLMEWNC